VTSSAGSSGVFGFSPMLFGQIPPSSATFKFNRLVQPKVTRGLFFGLGDCASERRTSTPKPLNPIVQAVLETIPHDHQDAHQCDRAERASDRDR
jgi:hypothetical protein